MFSTRPRDADRVDLGLAPGQRLHQADHDARAGHVPFHVFHAGGRLDRDAAGVEGDALADEGERRACPWPRGRPSIASRRGAAAARCPGRRRAARPCRASSSASRPAPRPRRRASSSVARRRGERLGIDDVGGLGDEVAGEEHRLGDLIERLRRRASPPPGSSTRMVSVLSVGFCSGFSLVRYLSKR